MTVARTPFRRLLARIVDLEAAPPAHASSHETGGDDEIGIALSQLPVISGPSVLGREATSGFPAVLTATQGRTALGLGGAATLNVGTTTGTVAAGDDSRLTDARTPKRHTIQSAATGPDNTASETDLFTASITAAAGDVFRLRLWGDQLNSTGSAQNLTIKLKLGSTTILTSTVLSLNSGAQRREWWMDVDLVVPTTSTQRAGAFIAIGAATAENFPVSASSINGAGYGTAAEDLTTAKTLSVTATLGVADANCEFLCQGASLVRYTA